ncbi:hypothetical protein ACWESM_16675 [Nocardia sp. NPDC003999]
MTPTPCFQLWRWTASIENGRLMGVDVNIEEMLDRLGSVIGPPPVGGVV